MRFEIRPPYIVFHDDKPGQHVTLFSQHGQKFIFKKEASMFNDARRIYAWAFEGTMCNGERVVFATTDREVVGVMCNDVVELDQSDNAVVRDADNKPIGITNKIAAHAKPKSIEIKLPKPSISKKPPVAAPSSLLPMLPRPILLAKPKI